MTELNRQRAGLGWPSGQALGWLSVGLGVAALLAPRKISRLSGIRNHAGLMQLIGVRELVSGAGLLTQPDKTPWLWARVVGDALDLAVLATSHSQSNRGRTRALGTATVLAAITAADVAASLKQSNVRWRSGAPDVYLERSIIVNKTPQECYVYWRDLRNVSKFTRRLENVTPLQAGRSRLTLKGPGGVKFEWTVELIEDTPGQRLRWRSEEGATLKHAGSANFRAAPGNRGTMVTLAIHYCAPGGSVGSALARFLGPDPFGEIGEDLRRFKQLIETGEIPTTVGQPSGRRSLLGRLFPEGRRFRQVNASRPNAAGPDEADSSASPSRASDGITPGAAELHEGGIS
jgi:uncharacterized membrane protein